MNAPVRPALRSKEDVLRALVDEISIPPHMDEKARGRYRSIGDWLNRDASTLKFLDPCISAQGSFMLGTVIRPVGDRDAYDVDLVCRLANATMAMFTQAGLKAAVGVEIRSYVQAHNMASAPRDGRRCWTLDYADEANFHLDILPCLNAEHQFRARLSAAGIVESIGVSARTAVGITDKTSPGYNVPGGSWNISNPTGYGQWFRLRQILVLEPWRRAQMARGRVFASVEDVPNHEVRTPLQDTIKLLKRHRDGMFDGDEDRPISIIISTLAARAYNGEATIAETLAAVLPAMAGLIETRGGQPWVSNPSYPLENFADKWPAAPRKQELFMRWLAQANRDFGEYLRGSRFNDIPAGLTKRLTERTVGKVVPRLALTTPALALVPAAAVQAETSKVIAEGRATKPWTP